MSESTSLFNDRVFNLELADIIVLTGSANLTLINVHFSDHVRICLYDDATLKMISVTNLEYARAPIHVTIQTENLGYQPFTLSFNGSDHFAFRIYWFNASALYDDGITHLRSSDVLIDQYTPNHSHLPSSTTSAPGQIVTWTLTWLPDLSIIPDHYAISTEFNSITLQHWLSIPGYPDFMIVESEES